MEIKPTGYFKSEDKYLVLVAYLQKKNDHKHKIKIKQV